MKSAKNLVVLAVVALAAAGTMVWKFRQVGKVTIDLLHFDYAVLGAAVLVLLAALALFNWAAFGRGTGRTWTITRRELLGYFFSPIGYIILLDFLAVVGYFFYAHMEMPMASANLYQYFSFWLFFMSMLTTPMITMRLFAEEKASGTLEMLVTAPVSETQIVLGKYFAALLFYAATLLPTLIYVVLLREYTPGAPDRPEWYKVHLLVAHLFRHQDQPEMGMILTTYLGTFLLGAMFLAIGSLVSSLTKHQVVAGMITLHILFAMWLAFMILTHDKWNVDEGSVWSYVEAAIKYAGFNALLESFNKGLIDSRGIIYTVTSVVFLLFMTVKSLEVRRWKL